MKWEGLSDITYVMGILILTIIDYYCPPYHDVLTNPNPINWLSAPWHWASLCGDISGIHYRACITLDTDLALIDILTIISSLHTKGDNKHLIQCKYEEYWQVDMAWWLPVYHHHLINSLQPDLRVKWQEKKTSDQFPVNVFNIIH